MNGSDFLAAIRTVFKSLMSDVRLPQKGIVTSYDPAKHMAKVTLQPQGLETSWMQVATMGVGSGFGITSGLAPGDEVLVNFEGGDINSGVIVGSLYNGQDNPTPTLPGETKLVHPSGTSVKFFADGSVELNCIGGLSIIAPTVTIATSGMTTSVAGLNVQNILTQQNFGPVSIPGSPTFEPSIHAPLIVPKPDT